MRTLLLITVIAAAWNAYADDGAPLSHEVSLDIGNPQPALLQGFK